MVSGPEDEKTDPGTDPADPVHRDDGAPDDGRTAGATAADGSGAEPGSGLDPSAATLAGSDLVLVVDDEPGAGDLAATYLERLLDGIETVTATSPEEALNVLRTRPVDCVVSDHDMPTATGLDLLADVRSEIGDVPFLLFTGKGSEEIASEAISAGVTDYLQKGGGPDQFEMLANRVDNALSHRRAEADLRGVNRKVTAIHEFATEVSGVDTAEAVFRRVVDVADEVLELDRCVAAERDGDRLYPTAISESVTPEEVRPFDVGEGIVGKTVAEGRTFLTDAVEDADDAEPVVDTITSAISVPIGEYGAFQAVSNGRGAFDESDAEFAELVASHAREAIEQIETEQTLRRERDRLASLFESLPSPVARISVDGNGRRHLDETNEAFESTFGRAADRDTLSETGGAIVPPGGTSIEPDQFDAGMDPIRTEVERRTVTGVRNFILNAIPTERGEDKCVYVVYTDIDEQKRVERTLQRLHETSREMFRAETRPDVAAVAARAAIDTLGFPTSGVRLYDPDAEALLPTIVTEEATDALGDRPPFGPGDGTVWTAFERGEAVRVDDLREADTAVSYGELRSLLVVPLGDHGVMPLGSREPHFFDDTDVQLARVLGANVAVALDRADRTERLQERDAALQRELDRLEKFAGLVSHDLRSPLNVASGRLALLREEVDDESMTPEIDRIEDAHDRMSELIDDLLVLAREGRTVDDPERVALPDAAREAWETVDTGDAVLEVPDGDSTVDADPERLRTLLENLFRNSVEHGSTSSRAEPDDSVEHGSTSNRAEPGDSVEHGSTSSRAEPDDSVEHGSADGEHDPGVTVTVAALQDGFSVADDGPGFTDVDPSEAMEYGVSSEPRGSGFGLAIAREIANAHGWETVVEDGADGARFEFRTAG